LIVLVIAIGWGCSHEPGYHTTAPLPGGPLPAAASLSGMVTIEFEATVTLVDDPALLLGASVAPGDGVSGTYVYNEFAPDQHHKSDIGRYQFDAAPCGIEVVINDLAFVTDPSSVDMTIRLLDDKKTKTTDDHYEVGSANNLPVLPGVGVADIDIELVDDTATALSSDELAGQRPATVWNPTHVLTITGDGGWTIEANIHLIDGQCSTFRPETKERIHRQ
jgi:hypothetical protein